MPLKKKNSDMSDDLEFQGMGMNSKQNSGYSGISGESGDPYLGLLNN